MNVKVSLHQQVQLFEMLFDGPAAQAIQGLALSAPNYDAAREILQDSFGKMQQIVSSHMENLLKVLPCDDKAHHLQSVYDKIYANI